MYEFIDAEYAICVSALAITQMCAWLEVSKSGFYEWRSRPESATARRREELKLLIKKAFDGRRTGPQADAAAWPGGLPAAALAAIHH